MSIRLILIDDEPATILGLRARLKHHRDFEVVGDASSGHEAIEKIQDLLPDAIFLDIEMSDSSGLSVVRAFGLDHRPVIVFLTAYPQYTLDAFEVDAADYLLKPIDEVRFEISLRRIRDAVSLRRPAETDAQAMPGRTVRPSPGAAPSLGRFAVQEGKRTVLLNPADIDWVKAAGDYAKLHVRDATYFVREPLSAVLRRLPPDTFCQIHRSFVVNLSSVADFSTLRNRDLLVTLNNGTVLRVSRTYSDTFRKNLTRC